jgi:hypothetical protein
MSAYDPNLLVTHVFEFLAGERCKPQLRASQTTRAEWAAAQLLLCLDVEPQLPVDLARHRVYGNSGPW